MDVVLHPKFAQNRFVYLNYTKPLDPKRNTVAIARAVWDGKALTGAKDIFVADERTGASRMAFGRDGMLFMHHGRNCAQDPNTHGGKVLRLRDDGSVPMDNPFVGHAGHKPEVYTRAIATRSVWRSTRDRRAVAEGERSQRRRRDQHRPARARTTAGRR